MCTALSFCKKHHYFGRNLDLERDLGQVVTLLPRAFPLHFRYGNTDTQHFAMLGTAVIEKGYPLFFEATNEAGLSMAGLNFPDNAHYFPRSKDRRNITSFELIPYLLASCKSTAEALNALQCINLWDLPFSDSLPTSPLHWLLSDKESNYTIEPMQDGLHIHKNPVGVLTNNPPFPYQLYNLANYAERGPRGMDNRMGIELPGYSLGLGGFGLPGDFSSTSRFVKAVFTRQNSLCNETEQSAICQFFHILASAAQPRGCTLLADGQAEYTRYSCCCNTDLGIYYFTTYEDPTITAVRLHDHDLSSHSLKTYPMHTAPYIRVL